MRIAEDLPWDFSIFSSGDFPRFPQLQPYAAQYLEVERAGKTDSRLKWLTWLNYDMGMGQNLSPLWDHRF
jgi:hypothetical protein